MYHVGVHWGEGGPVRGLPFSGWGRGREGEGDPLRVLTSHILSFPSFSSSSSGSL